MKTERIIIKGVVQGVGFRPFLYRLAKKLGLSGIIKNTQSGVEIIASGDENCLNHFRKAILEEKPPNAFIREISVEEISPEVWQKNYGDALKGVRIVKEDDASEVELDLLPDLAICKDCLLEFYDPTNRRFKHPFIACTNCGPRYGMLIRLPYERENTTMGYFPFCPDCQKEYTDPMNRRFHAEAIACPNCGPRLTLYQTKVDEPIAWDREALNLARSFIIEGKILAVKGLTGFHLICRADKAEIVKELRRRKRRPNKPFAVMFPSLELLKEYCFVDEEDIRLMQSPQSPIILVPGKELLPKEVAEGINLVGAMLPYTPIHLLLLEGLSFPVIATSGNFSDEPLIFEEERARKALAEVVDYFLVHDRKILRGSDDSVIKKVGTVYIMIRRGRGYAPYPQMLPFSTPLHILALGAEEKNTFTLGLKNRLIVSPHVGDLGNPETFDYFVKLIEEYINLYQVKSLDFIVCDLHPGYQSTRLAKSLAKEKNIPLLQVQHHQAHLLSVLAEEGIVPEGELLGFAWDGTGFGLDRSVWGGETLLLQGLEFKRIRSFRPFRLVGGETAIKDIRKIALSLLFEVYGEAALELPHPLIRSFSEKELLMIYRAWESMDKGAYSFPLCSSCGRLFDAISALAGVCFKNTYEGEAPMKLESLYNPQVKGAFPYSLKENFYFDWEPMVREVVEGSYTKEEIATFFINALADFLSQTVLELSQSKVILSGGVMVNGPLLKRIMESLEPKGIRVLRNKKFPPLDGGISLGQAYYGMLSFIFSKTS